MGELPSPTTEIVCETPLPLDFTSKMVVSKKAAKGSHKNSLSMGEYLSQNNFSLRVKIFMDRFSMVVVASFFVWRILIINILLP